MRFGGEVFLDRARGRAFGVLIWAVLVLLAGGGEAQAQSDDRKIEVGAQFSFFRESRGSSDSWLTPFIRPNLVGYPIAQRSNSTNNPGFGGRVGYNFSSHIAVEGEFNFLPRENIPPPSLLFIAGETFGSITLSSSTNTGTSNGWKTEAVFGLKAGGRIENFGLFAKVRPGLIHFSEVWSGGADTNFAMDLGTVIEYYPSRRTLIRVDLSDLIVHFDERPSGSGVSTFAGLTSFLQGTPAPFVQAVRPAQTTHNFRMGVGFGFRF